MIVAHRKGNMLQWLSWKRLPQLQWYKKLYVTKPHLFTEVNGALHTKTNMRTTTQQVSMLLNSCLKVAGSTYALALVLCDGDRKSAEFHETLEALNQRSFIEKQIWLETFEAYIKEYGIKVALIDDGITHWIENNYEIELKGATLKSYFSSHPERFERVDNMLFLLAAQKVLLENMFFRCVEVAGSEGALADWFSIDKLTKDRHLKNFERMGFKHNNSFKTYAQLFSDYLVKHQTLFEEEIIYA